MENKGNTAQMRLRISADLLHRFRSSKNGKYIQYFRIFGTKEPAQNILLSFLADLCGAALKMEIATEVDAGQRAMGIPIVQS